MKTLLCIAVFLLLIYSLMKTASDTDDSNDEIARQLPRRRQ